MTETSETPQSDAEFLESLTGEVGSRTAARLRGIAGRIRQEYEHPVASQHRNDVEVFQARRNFSLVHGRYPPASDDTVEKVVARSHAMSKLRTPLP